MAASVERIIRSSSEAWRLLKGCIAIHKPAGVTVDMVKNHIRSALAQGLNDLEHMERLEEQEVAHATTYRIEDSNTNNQHGQENQPISLESMLAVPNVREPRRDYSNHPLVLGNGFNEHDVRLHIVDPLTYRQCGLMMVAVNSSGLGKRIANAKMPRVYRVRCELGRLTDTGFADGRTLERSLFKHVKQRHLASALSAVAGSHRREVFRHLGVPPRSQAAYELAARGAVRPGQEVGGLVLGAQVAAFKPPSEVELEMQLLNEDENFMLSIVNEIGARLKTNATATQIRRLRHGMFGLHEHALLLKHVTLENVLNNIYLIKGLIDANEQLLAESANLQKPIIASENVKPHEMLSLDEGQKWLT